MADVPRAWAARIRNERKNRGWDKPEMARQLARAAGAGRASLPSYDSLLTYVKRWERGVTGISERYRLLYAAAFDLAEDAVFRGDAGVVTPDDQERLALAVEQPRRLDADAVEALATILSAQRRTEDAVGARYVIDTARSHLTLILRLLHEARGPIADRLAAIASDASQFAGWLSTATGEHDAAGPLYDQSLRLGLQARDADLAATALSMRGHLAWVTGDYNEMTSLSQAAADMAHAAGTRAVATQQRGRGLALQGDEAGALHAVGDAEDLLSAGQAEDPDSLYFYSPAHLSAQRGLILGYLAETPATHARAADCILDGVEGMPPPVRDSEWLAWYRARGAHERAVGGEVDEGVAALREAMHFAGPPGQGKTWAEIWTVLRVFTARWPDDPDVVELGDALR